MKYQLEGAPFPIATCYMDAGESIVCEAGAMITMTTNMQMETFAGKNKIGRMLTGERMFMNRYTARGGQGKIVFGAVMPGEMRAIEVKPGHDIVAQKGAFLAMFGDVEYSSTHVKNVGAAVFGGEGFFLQNFSGNGLVFLELDGYVMERDLAAGEQILINTGYMGAMDASCNMEVRAIPGVKNAMLGGEGLFNTLITGPGRVWVKTMPANRLAKTLAPYMPQKEK